MDDSTSDSTDGTWEVCGKRHSSSCSRSERSRSDCSRSERNRSERSKSERSRRRDRSTNIKWGPPIKLSGRIRKSRNLNQAPYGNPIENNRIMPGMNQTPGSGPGGMINCHYRRISKV